LHIGSLVPIMALAHMQKNGHRPIALIGGGTGLVGDPSGKTETRKLLTVEKVDANAAGIKLQLSRFIDFDNGQAFLLNNAEWLTRLKYIPFLRDIGKNFSVNRMIKAESYRMRLDSPDGLNFIEFNYMLLQAYDFLTLFDSHDCRLQMGGSDQWGNIVAGIELIRRMRQQTAFGITFPLITTSSGDKMGKTVKGAVWLDPARTSPYEYYQFWVNTDDRDVARFLALFTFLPMDEIRAVEKLEDEKLNFAKSILAFEATALAHGKTQAVKAYHASADMFGHRKIPKNILPSRSLPELETFDRTRDSIPTSVIGEGELQKGIPAFKLFSKVELAASGAAARRLIIQGGAYVNDVRVETFDYLLTEKDVIGGEIILRSGKKRFHRIKIGQV
jgi:tyrosyl-tRNA synthetase